MLPHEVRALTDKRATIDGAYAAYLAHRHEATGEIARAQVHPEGLLARSFPLWDDAVMHLMHHLSEHAEALVGREGEALETLEAVAFATEGHAAPRRAMRLESAFRRAAGILFE